MVSVSTMPILLSTSSSHCGCTRRNKGHSTVRSHTSGLNLLLPSEMLVRLCSFTTGLRAVAHVIGYTTLHVNYFSYLFFHRKQMIYGFRHVNMGCYIHDSAVTRMYKSGQSIVFLGTVQLSLKHVHEELPSARSIAGTFDISPDPWTWHHIEIDCVIGRDGTY